MTKVSFILFATLIVGLFVSPAKGQPQLQLPDKYQKWLTEEVVYIIEPYEKKTFLALKTDPEREQFIKEFWLRRDPDPDTEVNEYRDEYYERVAYANKHFAFGKSKGWRADRGHIYILYGEPGEKVRKSWGEIWKYQYIPGVGAGQVFEFVRVPGTQDLVRLKYNLEVVLDRPLH